MCSVHWRHLPPSSIRPCPGQAGSPHHAREDKSEDLPAIAHVVPEFLPRSATFIYTQLRFQEGYVPVVLAREVANLTEFPLKSPIRGLASPRRWHDRNRFTRQLAARWSTAYERKIADETAAYGCVALHAHFGWSGSSALRARRRLEIPLVTTFYGRDLAKRKRRFARGEVYERPVRRGHVVHL